MNALDDRKSQDPDNWASLARGTGTGTPRSCGGDWKTICSSAGWGLISSPLEPRFTLNLSQPVSQKATAGRWEWLKDDPRLRSTGFNSPVSQPKEAVPLEGL